VSCAATFNAQTSYDPRFIRDLFPGKDVPKIQPLEGLLCIKMDQLDSAPPEKIKLFEEVSPLTHLTRDDPPVLLAYKSEIDAKVTNANIGIHHPRFGQVLKEKMDALKIACELCDGTPAPTIAFLKRHLVAAPGRDHELGRRQPPSAYPAKQISTASHGRRGPTSVSACDTT
jgi:hypothetical protein